MKSGSSAKCSWHLREGKWRAEYKITRITRLYLLGTPDTSRKGRSTRKALSAFTSNPAPFPPRALAPSALVACSKIALKSLEKRKEKSCQDRFPWPSWALSSLKEAGAAEFGGVSSPAREPSRACGGPVAIISRCSLSVGTNPCRWPASGAKRISTELPLLKLVIFQVNRVNEWGIRRLSVNAVRS